MPLPANLATNDVIDETWVDAVTTTLAAAAPTAWVNVAAFTNGWVNFGATDTPARYRKVGDMVFIEGNIKSGVLNTAPGAFTLPAGFRPPLTAYFTSNSNGAFGCGYILNTGTVVPQIGSPTYFSLFCSFSTVA